MRVCEQTVKPRARMVMGHWHIRCPIVTIQYHGAIDDALRCWRAHRLHYQLNLRSHCK